MAGVGGSGSGMQVGFFMYLSMNDVLPGCLFAVVVI